MSADTRGRLLRDGLAAAGLEGLEPAGRFAPTAPFRCAAPQAAVRSAPGPDATQVDELLFGEGFAELLREGGFVFGQAERDGYVGWVDAGALTPAGAAPTHRVTALRTTAFAAADLKSPLRALLSLNALATVTGEDGRFLQVEGAGWLPREHLAAIGSEFERDAAGVAERFRGAPYVWGGRSSLGLDCSGLVQQALYACGRACPRDSDQQQALGRPVARGALARGDLVFWRGHVGMMLDGERLIHANAHHMAVAVEPLEAAEARIATTGGGEPTALRRP